MNEIAPGIFSAIALPPHEAATVVAAAAACDDWRAAVINADRVVDPAVRDAESLFEAANPALFGRCRDRLFAATREHAAELAPGTVLAELQIVRYRAGGKYVDHRDSPAPGATPRALSLVCYLNDHDDFSGGETTFVDAAVTIVPAAGMVAIFAPERLHRAEPVAAGTKYVLTAWYHTPPGRRRGTPQAEIEFRT